MYVHLRQHAASVRQKPGAAAEEDCSSAARDCSSPRVKVTLQMEMSKGVVDSCTNTESEVVTEWLKFYDERKGDLPELSCLPTTLGVAFSGGGVRAAAQVSALASRLHLLLALSFS